jgi:hypothetical protein
VVGQDLQGRQSNGTWDTWYMGHRSRLGVRTGYSVTVKVGTTAQETVDDDCFMVTLSSMACAAQPKLRARSARLLVQLKAVSAYATESIRYSSEGEQGVHEQVLQ